MGLLSPTSCGVKMKLTREQWAEKCHHAWCKEFYHQEGKPYWTNGDYSKLNSETKDYDRVMVDVFYSYIQELEEVIEALHEDAAGADI